MRPVNMLAFGVVSLLQVALAWAQPAGLPESRYAPVSSTASAHRDFPTTGHQWVGELEKVGIVNRSLRGPYRVALPLMTFGEGAALKLTYARSLPGSAGSSGPLLFVTIPLD